MQIPAETDPPTTAVRASLEAFGQALDAARALVQAGRGVDLTGLDAEMGIVCARMLDLPPVAGRALRPVLIGLRLQLEALAVTLVARAPPGCG